MLVVVRVLQSAVLIAMALMLCVWTVTSLWMAVYLTGILL